MILANVAVARELEESKTPTLYRVHGTPDETKLDRLTSALASLNIDAHLPAQEEVTTRDLQAITKRLPDNADRPFIESLIVRAMPQAVYQPENIGHFGLALTQYAHFTSPIRRYPDLVVHRTLKALIADQAAARRFATKREQLAAMGESTSKLEKRADEADRYVSTFLKCTYLRERIGQSFRGSSPRSSISAASCRFSMSAWMGCSTSTTCATTTTRCTTAGTRGSAGARGASCAPARTFA